MVEPKNHGELNPCPKNLKLPRNQPVEPTLYDVIHPSCLFVFGDHWPIYLAMRGYPPGSRFNWRICYSHILRCMVWIPATFMIYSGYIHGVFMIYSSYIDDVFMTYSWSSHDIFMKYSWLNSYIRYNPFRATWSFFPFQPVLSTVPSRPTFTSLPTEALVAATDPAAGWPMAKAPMTCEA